jgi:hypothetical protein
MCTDPKVQLEHLGKFKVKSKNATQLDPELKLLGLKNALLISDIGYTAKPRTETIEWMNLLWEEYYNQTDLERSRNLRLTLPYDRSTTNQFKSYSAFCEHITIPFFETWLEFVKSEEFEKDVLQKAYSN